MYKMTNQSMLRTVTCRISGYLSEEEMAAACEEYKRVTDTYRGRPHLVLADLRGLKPSSPEAAAQMQEMIAYGRAHGVVCCVHVSDSAIARLQAARLAREVSGGPDDVTIDVDSIEEAERVLVEQRQQLSAGHGHRSARPGSTT